MSRTNEADFIVRPHGSVWTFEPASQNARKNYGCGEIGMLTRFAQQPRAEFPAGLQRVIQERARHARDQAAGKVKERSGGVIGHDQIVSEPAWARLDGR